LVHANFTRALFKLIRGMKLTFEDFQTVDKDLYKRLRELPEYSPEVLQELCLDFTANLFDFERNSTHELIPGGKHKSVTRENLAEYIKVYSAWRMVDSVELQIYNFLEGVYDVVPVQLLTLFNECELEMMLCGITVFNVEEWKKNTVMLNFPAGHSAINWFWEILSEFDDDQRAMLFHFATGTSRLLSFEYLYPAFNVFCLPHHVNHLPFGHTCFNRLNLPLYPSKQVMSQKLLAAINYGSIGFELE